METQKIVNRTHFRRQPGANGWQWYWQTRANNGQITAVGGDGYTELRGAVNGFFSTHGIDPESASLSSNFGKLEKFADDHYVITQFTTE